jgi:hypothetical protein
MRESDQQIVGADVFNFADAPKAAITLHPVERISAFNPQKEGPRATRGLPPLKDPELLELAEKVNQLVGKKLLGSDSIERLVPRYLPQEISSQLTTTEKRRLSRPANAAIHNIDRAMRWAIPEAERSDEAMYNLPEPTIDQMWALDLNHFHSGLSRESLLFLWHATKTEGPSDEEKPYEIRPPY